jgi:hypothetical protein
MVVYYYTRGHQMKKSISIPSYMNDMLVDSSVRQKTSMSAVIQHALTIYFLMEKNAPKQIKALGTMIPKGQTDIFKFLKNIDRQGKR